MPEDHTHNEKAPNEKALLLQLARGDAAAFSEIYELYRDRAAFDAHEEQPHTKHFLEQRGLYLASYEVDWLTLQSGKGTAG